MTINKLTLTNFQSHKHSVLEFHSNVSAIVGESDEGKTSIIRALYWLSQNKPSGDDFISDFSKRGECSASIEVDGQTVTRFKNKTKNEYRIGKQEFKALGKQGVPDEVNSILQLSELNFQNQMDSPFLLSSNGGEVARYLNNIVNLNVIDESLTKIKAKVNGCDRDIKTTESEIENNKTELAELDWIETAEQELSKLDDDYYEFKNSQSLQEYLIDTLEEAEELEEKLEQYKDTKAQEGHITGLLDQISLFQHKKLLSNEFSAVLSGLKAISNQIGSLPLNKKEIESLALLDSLIGIYLPLDKSFLELDNLLADIDELNEKISTLNTDAEIKDFNQFEKLVTDYQTEEKRLVEFDSVLDFTNNNFSLIGQLNHKIEILEIEFKNEFPSECPLCGAVQ